MGNHIERVQRYVQSPVGFTVIPGYGNGAGLRFNPMNVTMLKYVGRDSTDSEDVYSILGLGIGRNSFSDFSAVNILNDTNIYLVEANEYRRPLTYFQETERPVWVNPTQVTRIINSGSSVDGVGIIWRVTLTDGSSFFTDGSGKYEIDNWDAPWEV